MVESTRKPTKIIPTTQLVNIYYVQYRVDYLQPGCKFPRIIVGFCRKGFQLTNDLSRQDEIWCINLATGDKFSKRRWKDYYLIDLDEEPRFGYFTEGSIIGILVDNDRGSINFFKDGNDLG